MTKRVPPEGKCCHCGKGTRYAWVHFPQPTDSPIHVCVECMNAAVVGHYTTPAYERVGQATYSPLLKPSPAKGKEATDG